MGQSTTPVGAGVGVTAAGVTAGAGETVTTSELIERVAPSQGLADRIVQSMCALVEEQTEDDLLVVNEFGYVCALDTQAKADIEAAIFDALASSEVQSASDRREALALVNRMSFPPIALSAVESVIARGAALTTPEELRARSRVAASLAEDISLAMCSLSGPIDTEAEDGCVLEGVPQSDIERAVYAALVASDVENAPVRLDALARVSGDYVFPDAIAAILNVSRRSAALSILGGVEERSASAIQLASEIREAVCGLDDDGDCDLQGVSRSAIEAAIFGAIAASEVEDLPTKLEALARVAASDLPEIAIEAVIRVTQMLNGGELVVTAAIDGEDLRQADQTLFGGPFDRTAGGAQGSSDYPSDA